MSFLNHKQNVVCICALFFVCVCDTLCDTVCVVCVQEE